MIYKRRRVKRSYTVPKFVPVVAKSYVKPKRLRGRRARLNRFSMNPLLTLASKSPFPGVYKCKIIQPVNYSLPANATTAGEFGSLTTFNLNDWTYLASNSLPGTDKMKYIYTYCIIYAAKVNVGFNDIQHQGMNIGIQVAAGSTLSTKTLLNQDVTFALDREACKVIQVPDDYKPPRFKKFIPFNKVFGVSRSHYMTDDRYQSTCANGVSAAPADVLKMEVGVTAPTSTGPPRITMNGSIVYYCKFFTKWED